MWARREEEAMRKRKRNARYDAFVRSIYW